MVGEMKGLSTWCSIPMSGRKPSANLHPQVIGLSREKGWIPAIMEHGS